MEKEIKEYEEVKDKYIKGLKYQIYKMQNGKTYLSEHCPTCCPNAIEISGREVDLIHNARELE